MCKANDYEVIIVGGGHAGIEAAVAAARLGVRTAIFTLSLDTIGNLPCNPSIGGTAKGHLVREVDALGGCMGILADATMIQSRMLNRGKGPAVHSLRTQADRAQYHLLAKKLLENTDNIHIKQAEIVEIIIEDGCATGVKTNYGSIFSADAIVIATGTYLDSKIYIGEQAYASGPDGISAAQKLGENIKKIGLNLRRFKTGTPARVHRRSINFDKLEIQHGDEQIFPFSFMTEQAGENKVTCHIAYTNPKTHEIITNNLHRSAMYAGMIEGAGPRYCPSIEDKVVRFADKNRHQIFVEPCGLNTDEYYLQGMSSSLPEDVQQEMYRSIEGLEQVELMRPAYAIEYDCVDPTQLKPTLECKTLKGLFGAGQFCGSSGYEEAAAQGLLAGINAAKYAQKIEGIILSRQQSYIGTLIDDLVTKGTNEPYRMMTSRSEHRLYLRQDNADERLTPLGREVGLVEEDRWERFSKMLERKNAEMKRLKSTKITPEQLADLYVEKVENLPKQATSAAILLKRPELSYAEIVGCVGEGEGVTPLIADKIQTEIKYEGYIKNQLEQIEVLKNREQTIIPADICYAEMNGLRLEAREKLQAIRPVSLGQAARIPGVSPSDVAQLSLILSVMKRRQEEE